MQRFSNTVKILYILPMIFLISCSGEKSFEELYVGNWYGEEKSEEYVSHYLYIVKSDYTFDFRSFDFDTNANKVYKSTSQGVWSYKDGILDETFTVIDGVKLPETEKETIQFRARFIDHDTLEVITMDGDNLTIINNRVDDDFVIPDPRKK